MSAWYEKAVFYHIYPFGLCGVEKENTGKGEYHFEQLEEWISHIKQLGCSAIYIGPLFESVGHGYETTDYKMVDRRLGTNEDFKQYVSKCHDAGIQVIVDGVFNHTGREFFAFKDIREHKEQSKYKDWYCNVNFGGNTEYNDGFSYDNWGGYNLLAKLNQKNPEVKEYIYDVIRFWVKEFDIDGIRLDAADVLDFDFIKGMRAVANEVKEDFWLMGEVIHGDYGRWVNKEMLHSVTNYELHKGLYSGHNDHNYFEIAHSVKRLMGLCGDARLYTFLDNHDVARIASKLNDKAQLYPATVLIYTLYGIPAIYYGSEFSVEGKKEKGSDANLRPFIDLNDYAERSEKNHEVVWEYKDFPQKEILDLIIKLGHLKQDYEELTEGEYKELVLTNRQFAFARVMKDSCMIIAVNNDEKEADMTITVPISEIDDKKTKCCLDEKQTVMIEQGKVKVNIKENSGEIIYITK